MGRVLWTSERQAKLKMLVRSGVPRADLSVKLGLPADTALTVIQSAIARYTLKSDRDQGARIRGAQNSHTTISARQKSQLSAEVKPVGHSVTWGAFMGSTPFPAHLR